MFFYVVKVIQIYLLGLFSRPKAKKRSRDLGDIPHPKVSRARRVVDDEPKDSTCSAQGAYQKLHRPYLG